MPALGAFVLRLLELLLLKLFEFFRLRGFVCLRGLDFRWRGAGFRELKTTEGDQQPDQ